MMAATAYSVALLGGARLPAAPRSAALLPRRSACQLRLQGNFAGTWLPWSWGRFLIRAQDDSSDGSGRTNQWWVLAIVLWRPALIADAPRLSLLRVKAASEDTSASADELIEDLKAKVRRVLPTVPCAPPRRGIHGHEAM